MNNFVFGDPLLYRQMIPQADDFKQQLDAMNQYQLNQSLDHVGELDNIIKNLDENIINTLQQNSQFVEYNNQLQQYIQTEILNTVKWKLNNNPQVITLTDNLKSIINNTKKQTEELNKQNINEINDYIKNYSDMTFSEYKKLKNESN